MSGQGQLNRLARETSPYLKQHAENPVDWYPWGPEALDRARREDKPIFLSIGYSTCHWCHVMAHECFENPRIAAIMNEHFVNIKVDREERPDLDETYMTAVQLLTGRGGWPMSVFLTPDLKPFYGGTYFPPEDRGGLPGLPRLLLALSQAYHQKQDTLANVTGQIEDRLKLLAEMPATTAPEEPAMTQVTQAVDRLKADFDGKHGGFGGAPKFPRALELGLLLHYSMSQGEASWLEMVSFSLEKMARGGIYDQAGGGFHRYTVDGAWVVPHFEKMLYDNALLPPLYLAWHQLTGNPLASRIARETLDFVLREMQAPQGGFYAAWDADSEGQEGKFYVWSQAEVEQAVGPKDATLVLEALGITPGGNFEGHNILIRPLPEAELARRHHLTVEQVEDTLRQALDRLLAERQNRVPPHRDEKIIASWNGLMLSALAGGFQVLGDRRYYEAAARGARFLLEELFRDGRLHRIWAGGQVSVPGFLEDYALLANACLDLYESDLDPAWLATARRLANLMEELFLDPEDGSYFYVARDQEATLVRGKSVYDQVIPSGNSMAARVCWRLYRVTGESRYQERALAIIQRFQSQALENPQGFSHLLTLNILWLTPPLDLVLVGEAHHPRIQEMLRVIYHRFLPERCLLLKDPGNYAFLEELAPPAKHYGPAGEDPVVYLCHNFTCQPPLHDPAKLEARLAELAINH